MRPHRSRRSSRHERAFLRARAPRTRHNGSTSPTDRALVDLRDYARTLRKRWALVALCTLLGLGAAAAATLLSTKMYTSSTQLFVSSREQTSSLSDALQGSQFAQQRIKSYAQVADSPGVTDGVAKQLNISPEEMAAKVTADAPLD